MNSPPKIYVNSLLTAITAVTWARHLYLNIGGLNDIDTAVQYLNAAIDWCRYEAVHCPGRRRRIGRAYMAFILSIERNKLVANTAW
jgi:hypothetical protein